MEIQLTDDEAAVLRDLLVRTVGTGREELYKTENFDYKETLKKRQAVLNVLLTKLGRGWTAVS